MPILEGYELLEQRTTLQQMWGDDQIRKNFTAKADSVNAILARQTAQSTALQSTDKDYDVKVRWMNFTDETVSTFDPTEGPEVCNLDGPEVTSEFVPYALDTFVEKSFKVEETGSMTGGGFRSMDATFQEAVNVGMLKTRKALVEDMNKRVLAKLDTFAGTNKYAGGYTVGAGGDTTIPAGDFGVNALLPYLARVQMMNRYQDSYILDGGLLWDDLYRAGLGAVAGDQVQLQRLVNEFGIVEDMWGFAQAGLEDRLFLVDRSAVGLFTKHQIQTGAPIDRPNDRRDYTLALPELGNNVIADVHYQYKCEDNRYFHVWKLVLRYGLLANPTIEDTDLTGVLAFVKGS